MMISQLERMSPEDKRATIAELRSLFRKGQYADGSLFRHDPDFPTPRVHSFDGDYFLLDLNAMKSAEDSVEIGDPRIRYEQVLAGVVARRLGFKDEDRPHTPRPWYILNASAGERADAFLLTFA